jgi:hypothetical protein
MILSKPALQTFSQAEAIMILLGAAKWYAEHPAGNTEKRRIVSRLHLNFSRITRLEL